MPRRKMRMLKILLHILTAVEIFLFMRKAQEDKQNKPKDEEDGKTELQRPDMRPDKGDVP